MKCRRCGKRPAQYDNPHRLCLACDVATVPDWHPLRQVLEELAETREARPEQGRELPAPR